MAYDDYSRARDLSWHILIKLHVTELPVSLAQTGRALGVTIRSYSQAAEVIRTLGLGETCSRSDGLSFAWRHESYILYNSFRPLRRIRFTIAHELGHCLLRHNAEADGGAPLCVDVCADTRTVERQANTFAADLLAPACVLRGLGVTTAGQVASICNISLEAGRIRLQRLRLLEARNAAFLEERGYGCFLLSPLERRVYEQFRPFIRAKKFSP